jgi:hypothetical protein
MAREIRLKERETKTQKEIAAEHAQRNDDRLSAMHCKVCLLPYHTTELQNSLPFKMLMEYKQHTYLSGRPMLDLSHLRVTSVSFLFHTVRICTYCYMLILEEHKLIHMEQRLASMMNIPVNPINVLNKISFMHPSYMPHVMP